MSAPLSLDAPVSILEFSLKPRKALKALRVRTLQDLLSLDVTRVQGLSGCGVGTVQQIEDARKWLAADIAALSHDQTDHISSEASEARFYQYVVRSLPSGVVPILEGFGIKTLLAFLRLTRDQARAIDGITYRTWQSIKRVQRMCRNRQAVFAAQYPQRLAGADGKSWPFDHLAATLSGKARHVLHLKGICTAANWLKLTEAEVLSIRGIGVGTWRELQRVRMRLGEDMPQYIVVRMVQMASTSRNQTLKLL